MRHHIRWTANKIDLYLDLLRAHVYRRSLPLPEMAYAELDRPVPDGDPAALAADATWQPLPYQSYWGRPRTDFLLRTTVTVPDDWPRDVPLVLWLPIGDMGGFSHPEALLYLDGQSLAAVDRHHQEVLLPPVYHDGQPHDLVLHGWTGNWHRDGTEGRSMLRPCVVAQVHAPTRELIALTRNVRGSVEMLDENSPARHGLLNALDRAFRHLDTREPLGDAFYASVGATLDSLRQGIAAAGDPLDVSIAAAGHAHIDVAWLWTLADTRGKARRTFHTVDALMDQFPEYRFTQSQPQLYDYIRQDDPRLFERIQARVAEGRWETIGGMWVEADCNLTGAEALARQFLLGRAFFAEHFGPDAESPVLWLPDVFGYSWALPQLIKQAGLDYFMTIKISWNQVNKMPYDSFWWQGIDGSRVLTHFSTTPGPGSNRANYNATATPREVYGTWSLFQQKADQRHLLMSFGYGDGGGGPTREMLENISVMGAMPGMPRIRHSTVRDFFTQMEAEAGDSLPTWNGELYLEIHRGTYTTQARNKRANRQSEFLLHDVELLAAFAALLDSGYTYPQAELTRLWQVVCLNQFHDIIPGSSIQPVYVESLAQYAEVLATGRGLRDAALAILHAQTGGDLLVANPTGFLFNGALHYAGELPAGQRLESADGRPIAAQPAHDGGTWLDLRDLPPHSLTPLRLASGDAPGPASSLSAAPDHLENALIRVEFNADGDITRIYDKQHQREVMPPGALANQFQAFEDRPMNWDAWDIDIYYDDKQWLSDPATRVEVVEAGPLAAALRVERRILHSPYTQVFTLTADSPQVTITTTIDWRERHILLKAAFPVAILADKATYEIQWGNVERPTHRNTSWDWARFETVAQKWVDLSEGGYGVSLLNDCKYGHDIHGDVIRISLLRAPTNPDPEADRAEHTFTVALLPHAGDWRTQTIPAAYQLNDPPVIYAPAQPAPLADDAPLEPLVAVDAAHVVIETVKRAEDGDGIIVRLYESQRQRGPVVLRTAFDLAAAQVCDLLEAARDDKPVTVEGRRVRFEVTPFEIVTLRLRPV